MVYGCVRTLIEFLNFFSYCPEFSETAKWYMCMNMFDWFGDHILFYFCFIVCTSFCFVNLANESDMKKAQSLSGSSLKGGTVSIEVSKKRETPAEGGKKGNFNSRGGFTSPRGAGHQGGSNRGKLQCFADYISVMFQINRDYD